jgi:hypothetical protein
MNPNSKASLIAGVAMLLVAISTVAVVAIMASTAGDGDPFDKKDVASFLTDVADNQNAMITASAIGLFCDAFLVLVIGSMLFVLFRDRSSVLAPADAGRHCRCGHYLRY